MKYFLQHYAMLFCFLLAIAGCRQPGPVELHEPDQQGQDLEVLTAEGFSPSNFGEIDSTSPHPPIPLGVTGRLLIEGLVVEGPQGRHTASTAHAVFFDKSSPIVINGDTVAYALRDAGNISISQVMLNKRDMRFRDDRLGIDTLLGIEYFLVNKNGMGGRGFRYVPNKIYDWYASGTTLFPSLSVSVMSAPEVLVTQPMPSAQVNVNEHLTVRWNGGGNSMKLIVSSVERRLRPKPIFQARIRQNRHGVLIPKKILQALPSDQQNFLITISSETNEIRRDVNLPGPVLLQTSSSHSIMIRLVR
jgi:hypothetical protein